MYWYTRMFHIFYNLNLNTLFIEIKLERFFFHIRMPILKSNSTTEIEKEKKTLEHWEHCKFRYKIMIRYYSLYWSTECYSPCYSTPPNNFPKIHKRLYHRKNANSANHIRTTCWPDSLKTFPSKYKILMRCSFLFRYF